MSKAFRLAKKMKDKIDKIEDLIEGEVRLNSITRVIEVDGRPIDEYYRSRMKVLLEPTGVSGTKVDQYIDAIAWKNSYNPFRSYFENLPEHDWSQSPIDDMIDCMRFKQEEGLCRKVIKMWIVGCVEKVMRLRDNARSHQNPVLCLSGKQGIGKSTWARWLCSDIGYDYFREDELSPSSDTSKRMAAYSLIWELAEVSSVTRKSDVEALKAFITTKTFSFRIPYARDPVHVDSTTSFVATNNPSEGFLNDPTGYRRWLIVNMVDIDFSYSKVSPAAIWSEALALLRDGHPLELEEEEQEKMNELLFEHEIENPTEEFLMKYFEIDRNSEDMMLTTDVIAILDSFGVRISNSHSFSARDIAKCLKKFGLERKVVRVGKSRSRGWKGIKPRKLFSQKEENNL